MPKYATAFRTRLGMGDLGAISVKASNSDQLTGTGAFDACSSQINAEISVDETPWDIKRACLFIQQRKKRS